MVLKNKISFYLLCVLLFLLPWQTRYIYKVGNLAGLSAVASAKADGFWEYGTESLYATELLLGLTILVFLIEFLRNSRTLARLRSAGATKRSKLRLLEFGMVLLYCGFVMGQSVLKAVVWQKLHFVLFACCLGALIYLYRIEKEKLFFSLWLGGVVQGALGLYQFLTQRVVAYKWLGLAAQSAKDLGASVIEFRGSNSVWSSSERWLRAYGAFGSPNILGGFLAIVFVVGLLLYLKTESFIKKILLLVGELVVLAGLVVTFSRAAWIAVTLGAVVCVVGVVREKKWGVSKHDVLRVLVCSVVVVGILFFSYKPLFTTRVGGTERLEVQSDTTRREQYVTWLQILKNKPLFGTGPGMYTYELWREDANHPVWYYQPIHNTFLLFVGEWGMLGVLLWGFVLWRMNLGSLARGRLSEGGALLVVFCVTASLDHYYWSLYGGMMLTSVVFAFILAPAFSGQAKNLA